MANASLALGCNSRTPMEAKISPSSEEKEKQHCNESGSTNNKKRTQGTVIKMMTKFNGLLLQGENGFNSNYSIYTNHYQNELITFVCLC